MFVRTIFRGWLSALLLTVCMPLFADEADRLFKVYDSSNGLADNSAQTIACTRSGRLVISSIGHVNFYDGYNFIHIDPTPENVYPLPKYLGHYHLFFDDHFHLWLKDKQQVTCVDLIMGVFITDVQGELKKMGFDKKADDLFVCADSSVMLLTNQELYNCRTKKSYPVKKGRVLQDVEKFQNRFLLFYDDSSVDVFDASTGKRIYSSFGLDEKRREIYNQSSVVEVASDGIYQIKNGQEGGILLHLDVMKGEWKVVMEQSFHLNNMEIHNQLLYIAAQFGYLTYNMTTGEQQHYKTIRNFNYQEINTDINDIAFDKQGGMWIGTKRRGLLYSKPFQSPFRAYDWSNPKALKYGEMMYYHAQENQEPLPRRVNCIFHDSRGWTWHGTYTGLKLYKTGKEKEPIVYTMNDGLANNVVHSIVEDDAHRLWVATSNGISVLLFENGEVDKIVSYDDEDNIPKETFDNGRAMKLPDGTIIMQSLDHVVEFNPASFHTIGRINMQLYPKMIRLSVNGQLIETGEKYEGIVILDNAITLVKKINLKYNQNTLSMVFTGRNYFRPTQTYYRVRIKGLYDWHVYSYYDKSGRVDELGMLHLPVIDIEPGEYLLELQASMSPDEFPDETYQLIISVNQPWWRRTFLYITLGVLLLGLLIANFIYYNRNTRLKLNRSNIEITILNRIKAYAKRCEDLTDEVLHPSTSDTNQTDVVDEANSIFMQVMGKVVPYVSTHEDRPLTMYELSVMSGMELDQFYETIADNLYKSPLPLVLTFRLQRAAEMLVETNKGVDEIAEELKFASPNFFIASFYHEYRQTPDDYRASNPR